MKDQKAREVQPLLQMPNAFFKNLQGVCFDLDDTVTTNGFLESKPYEALWMLKKAGFSVVMTTGRPAGWCDHFARFWPIDAVVGENGAFWMEKRNQKVHTQAIDGLWDREEAKRKQSFLKKELLKYFPQIQFATDQDFRWYDVAVDIAEEVPVCSGDQIKEVLLFAKNKGVQAKVSSIHINLWYGNYDKSKGFFSWLKTKNQFFEKEIPHQKRKKLSILDRWIYVGDSPNDEPMFHFFSKSVGVQNIVPYLSQMLTLPSCVTRKKSGDGFCELVEWILKKKNF